MIPRFFVSSTYYDLKHVRERLEKFIDNYGFQPILFESDKVTYQQGKEIDQSAYFEVGLCHIMALIIGGRYGSSASQDHIKDEQKAYDENFISITRREFETAISKNIPVLIFIEKNVYAEYQTYKENQEFFDNIDVREKNSLTFKFAHVDNLNVFRFIDIVKSKPIKTFDKVEEIEGYIKSQLSGMFFLYLESLKQASDDKKILDTIAELNSVTLRMNEMVNVVGKQILGEDKQEYENVIHTQFQIIVDFLQEKVQNSIVFEQQYDYGDLASIDFEEAARLLYDDVLNIIIPSVPHEASASNWYKKQKEVAKNLENAFIFDYLLISDKLHIKSIDIRGLNTHFGQKVKPFIKNQAQEDGIRKRIASTLKDMLDTLPF